MTPMKKTLENEIHLSGIGIHSGKHADLILKPSIAGEIVFYRTDMDHLEFRLDPKKIEAKNSISLKADGKKIQTIEHLMATFYAFGIDSLIVELNGGEIPIMDGSAFPFVEAICEAGVKPLPERKKSIKILKPFQIREKDAFISVNPGSGFRVDYSIEYDHPAIMRQELALSVNIENFKKEIAPARTFGFLQEVPALRAQGLALGGSFQNALVLDEKGVINGPLRFSDEFVRHKVLDFIGDLSLLGSPLIGHFHAHKTGHRHHIKVIHFLLDEHEFWTFV